MYCNAAGGAARVVDYEEQAKPPLLPPQGVGDSVYRKSVGRDDSARRLITGFLEAARRVVAPYGAPMDTVYSDGHSPSPATS